MRYGGVKMISRFLIYSIVVGSIFVFLFSINILAQNTDAADKDIAERIQLIQASQNLSQEKKDAAVPRSAISLYVTNYHTDDTEYKLGGKFEQRLFNDSYLKGLGDLSFSYVIDGIYLEGESTSLAGFLSLKATLNNRSFSPYVGAGAEFMGAANYQGFVGLNINKNFFVETKFINDKDVWDDGSFYSVTGFKIDF
jgi:hypothetical protein